MAPPMCRLMEADKGGGGALQGFRNFGIPSISDLQKATANVWWGWEDGQPF